MTGLESHLGLSLDDEEIDDILYYVRVNDQEELDNTVQRLHQKYSLPVRLILEGAVADDSRNSALHFAAANGLTSLLDHLLLLLSSSDGTVPNLVNCRNKAGSTPLHWAALNGHLKSVTRLVGAGADLWCRNEAGNLAVFEAERAGHDDVVAELLRLGGTEKEREDSRTSGRAHNVNGEEGDDDIVMSAGVTEDDAAHPGEAVAEATANLAGASLDP